MQVTTIRVFGHLQTNRHTYKPIAGLLLAMIFIAAMTWFTHQSLIGMYGNRVDFYPTLVGMRAFWSGESPYTDTVTERIQTGMFGSRLAEGEDQQRVAHPAYTFVLLTPLLLLPDDIALALWASLQLLAFMTAPFIWFNMLNWRPRPWLAALLVISLVFFFRYPMISYVLAQFVGVMLFSISLGIWCLVRGRHSWAGVALAFATMPPSFGAPLIVLLLAREVLQGRWRTPIVFASVMGTVFLITVLRIGWWLPDWLANLNAYREYASPDWAAGLLPPPLQLLFLTLVIVMSLWTLWQTGRMQTGNALVDYTCIVLLALFLLLPITGDYYFAFLIPIVIVSAWRIAQRRALRLPMSILLIALLLLPWLHLSIPDGWRYQFLTMPLLAAMLWWMTQRGSTPSAITPVSRP